MPNELKPCPFCGSKAYAYRPMHNTLGIFCSNLKCGASITQYGCLEDDVAERWNRRANDEQAD